MKNMCGLTVKFFLVAKKMIVNNIYGIIRMLKISIMIEDKHIQRIDKIEENYIILYY